jgi:hypothetical protein
MPSEMTRGLKCSDIFEAIYRIAAPEDRELFVTEIYSGAGVAFDYLLVYDPARKKVTMSPPRLFAKWADSEGSDDGFSEPPFVSFVDLYQSGHPLVVFEERTHNGNVYDAVIYHYYDVGEDLGLKIVLARETRVMPVLFAQRKYTLAREVTPVGANRVRMDLYKTLAERRDQKTAIGYESGVSTGPGAPFRVTERHIDHRRLKDFDTYTPVESGEDMTSAYDFYY